MSWLSTSIASGFKLLMPLNLDHAPSLDQLPEMMVAWEKALSGLAYSEQAAVAPRIAQAFKTIASTAERWPNPTDLRKAMPPMLDDGFQRIPWTPQEIEVKRREDKEHWQRMNLLTGENYQPVFLSVPPGHPKVCA